MKHRLLPSLVMLLLLPWSPLLSQPSANWLLTNGPLGREFWIAFPQNENTNYRGSGGDGAFRLLEIYVTSFVDTKFTLHIPGVGIGPKTYEVKAMKITTISSQGGPLNESLEMRDEGGGKSLKAIHITAEDPISVYVMSAHQFTSEGYLALPVEAWGKRYIHVGHYDYKDLSWNYPRGSGFVILAKDFGTVVQIRLRGRNNGYIFWQGNKEQIQFPRDWNKLYTITLNKGEAFVFQTTGESQEQLFDITGTEITATKPIGIISYHVRSIIPIAAQFTSRDHLLTMPPPVHAWGKQYIAGELLRENRGDYFRIVASQDSTTWEVTWYDKQTGDTIGQLSGLLANAGEFFEYLNAWQPGQLESIRGFSVWTADKPVLVCQYSYSSAWDNSQNFDPFYYWIVPVEQYGKSSIFQTPSNRAFTKNYLNILAIGDPNDPKQQKLKTIKLDGQYVWQRVPSFLSQRIPGTNVYYAVLNVNPGPHRIEGETPFGGYIYGFATWESYGWPAATLINKIDELDTLAPSLFLLARSCRSAAFKVTENQFGNPHDVPRQIDQGISKITLLPDRSSNCRLVLIDPASMENTGEPIRSVIFRIDVIDSSRNATAVFAVTDRAGNIVIDSISFLSVSIIGSSAYLFFDTTLVGTTKTQKWYGINTGDKPVTIHRVILDSNATSAFTILTTDPPLPTTLPPGDTLAVTLQYAPQQERSSPGEWETATLIIQTECGNQAVAILRGQGVQPRLIVEDWNAGAVVVGSSRCSGDPLAPPLRLYNPGSAPLIISKVSPLTASVSFSHDLPIVLPPGSMIFLNGVCFTPSTEGERSIPVRLRCNIPGTPIVSFRVRGVGIAGRPFLTSYNWGWRPTGSHNIAPIALINAGSAPVTIDHLLISPPTFFSIVGYQQNNIPLTSLENFTLQPNDTVWIWVSFNAPLQPTAANDTLTATASVYLRSGDVLQSKLQGQAYQSNLLAQGYSFQCAPIGIVSNEVGQIWMRNISTSEMQIDTVLIVNASDPDAFFFSDLPLPIALAPNQQSTLSILFLPQHRIDYADIVLVSNDFSDPDPSAFPEEYWVRVTGCATNFTGVSESGDWHPTTILVHASEQYVAIPSAICPSVPFQITLYSSYGKKLGTVEIQPKQQSAMLYIGNLAAGIYYCTIADGTRTIVLPMVVLR